MEMKIEVFGSNDGTCGYCEKTISTLNEMDLKFVFNNIKEDGIKDILKEKRQLENLKGQTIPQVFINEDYIGGYTELLSYIK